MNMIRSALKLMGWYTLSLIGLDFTINKPRLGELGLRLFTSLRRLNFVVIVILALIIANTAYKNGNKELANNIMLVTIPLVSTMLALTEEFKQEEDKQKNG